MSDHELMLFLFGLYVGLGLSVIIFLIHYYLIETRRRRVERMFQYSLECLRLRLNDIEETASPFTEEE